MEEKLQSPPPQPQSTPNIDALLARLSRPAAMISKK